MTLDDRGGTLDDLLAEVLADLDRLRIALRKLRTVPKGTP